MDYLLHTIVLLCIYATMAVALSLVMGTGGMFSPASAAFMGIGAYATALLSLHVGLGVLPSALLGVMASGIAGLLVGLFSLRLAGTFLMIGAFAFQMLAQNVFLNWIGLTGGFQGIAGIPYPEVFGLTLDTPAGFAPIAVAIAVVTVLAGSVLTRSPYGRLLRAIRDDEMAARAVGKSTRPAKIWAFVLQGAFTGLAGVAYAHYTTFISSGQFIVDLSILVISAVVLGGLGNVYGAVLGAAAIVVTPEILRFAHVPSGSVGFIQASLYGAVVLLIVFVRPQGILSERRMLGSRTVANSQAERSSP